MPPHPSTASSSRLSADPGAPRTSTSPSRRHPPARPNHVALRPGAPCPHQRRGLCWLILPQPLHQQKWRRLRQSSSSDVLSISSPSGSYQAALLVLPAILVCENNHYL